MVAVTPSMGQSVDVTALLGSKRKREQRDAIRPVLRGSLMLKNGKVVWSGCWGLTKQNFSDEFGTSVVRAPFYFERKSLASENLPENGQLSQDGYFSGYFCMQDLSQGQRSVGTYKKFAETEVLLRFSKTKTSKTSFEVVGSGENKFGKYLIEGTFDALTNELLCARNYLSTPIRKKLISPKPKVDSPATIKRSSRVRIPSLKYRESYAVGTLKRKSISKAFEFEGREELLSLLRNLRKVDDVRVLKMLDDLEKKKVRSLKSALTQIESLLAVLVKCEPVTVASNELEIVRKKYGVNQKVLSKKPTAPKDHRPEVDEQEPQAGPSEYVSLFDDIKEMQDIDPMSFNPACRLPERLKSPVLTASVIDLKDIFSSKHFTRFRDDNIDIPVEDTGDSDSEELYPINDVDFSDLNHLDAETLKELNEYVEFSCPSKGA